MHSETPHLFFRKRWKVPGGIRYSLWVVGVLLAVNFVLRVVFLFYNFARAEDIPTPYLLKAFLTGLRFDLATIMLFNGIIFLFLSLPLSINRQMRTYRVVNLLILFINLPVFIINSIDVVYFGFADKRLTHELYSTNSAELFNFDMLAMLRDYGWLLLLFILLAWLFYRLLNRITRHSHKTTHEHTYSPRYWWFPLGVSIVIFLGMRGGPQSHALDPADAFNGPGAFTGDLGLNSAYTVYFSVRSRPEQRSLLIDRNLARKRVKEKVADSFDKMWLGDEFPFMRRAEFDGPEKRYNVVFLVIESFDALNVGRLHKRKGEAPSLTPFFDSLSNAGVLYSNYFAPANRSIEFPPSVINSIPDIFHRPLIGSDEEAIHQYGLAAMLKARGYHTSFFHGGKNGTMGFDRYSAAIGFDHYSGFNEYPEHERDYDGGWGIYDGPFLNFWADQLMHQTPEPFFSLCFTLSNHHPFFIPKKGCEDILNLPLSEYQKTNLYTDRCLREFFSKVSKADGYARTVFVITGDHTFHELNDPDETEMTHANVPLLIIAPGLAPKIDDRPCGHLNLLPTLIEILQLDTWHASAGSSLLGDPRNSFAIYSHVGVQTLVENGYAWSDNFTTPQPFWFYQDGSWHRQTQGIQLDPSLRKTLDEDLRSLYQTYADCRFQNTWWKPGFENHP